MSLKDIDIRKKCPKENDDTGTCQDDQSIQADKGDLEGTPHYGYVTHSGLSGRIIKGLTYSNKPLQIKNGKITAAFSREYSNLEKVTTYYYTKNNSNADHINVPLIIRVRNKGGAYHLYINKGGDHTKWEKDSHTGDTIPANHNTTPYLTKKLNRLTCQLHKLHRIDLKKSDKDPPYYCTLCSRANVKVKTVTKVREIYTKFEHTLTDDGKYYVTYKDSLIKYQGSSSRYNLISVSKKDCKSVSVYYWDGDDKLNNPLLIEVESSSTRQSIWYENIVEPGGEHDRWKELEPGEATNLYSGNSEKLKERLDSLSCIFNGTVKIQLGKHSACHISNDPRHKDRLNILSDGTFHRELSLSTYVYTHSKIYGNKPFSVTEIFLGDNRQIFPDAKFFKDVIKVTSCESNCSPGVPFLLCIEYTSITEKYRWYKRSNGDIWQAYPGFYNQSPDSAKTKIGTIFSEAQKTLKIQACEKKPPPLTGLQIDIRMKPTGDKLATMYKVHSSSGEIPIAVVKILDSPMRGFFRVIHRASTDTGSFTVSKTLGNGDGIRGIAGYVESVSVYFGNSNPSLPILLGIKTSGDKKDTKYYSRTEVARTSRGNWARQNGYDKLTSTDLSDMLDDQNGKRNSTIPIDLKDPVNFEPFYKTIMEKTGTNPHLKTKSYISSLSDSLYILPKGAKKDYKVEVYQVKGGAIVSRVTYGGKADTDIEPPEGKVSQLRVYKWIHGGTVPLLVEFISSGTSDWSENLTKGSLTWAPIGEEVGKFYNNGSLQEDLTEKLDEVSCNIHNTVRIDISKKSDTYCHSGCSTKKRIKVEKSVSNLFTEYLGYEHISAINDQDKFTVTSVWNSKNKQEATGNFPNFPIKDVNKVTVYFPECDGGAPVAIRIEPSHGQSIWLTNKGGKNEWENVSDKIRDNNSGITELLNSVKSSSGVCPKLRAKAQPSSLQDGDEDARVLDQVSKEEEEDDNENAVDDDEYSYDESSSGLQAPDQGKARGSDLPTGPGSAPAEVIPPQDAIVGELTTATIVGYVAAGTVLTASGSLTGFAYWIYKRFAGEPWVRQI